ncbi:MAG: hypothetical protein IJB11_02575, partial [Oscillospiraceae bacterium]|nr:hypothetical protein [Oscillospiraceae bacterium]
YPVVHNKHELLLHKKRRTQKPLGLHYKNSHSLYRGRTGDGGQYRLRNPVISSKINYKIYHIKERETHAQVLRRK